MKFDFTKRKVRIGKINLRDEHHGDEKKLAIDVPLTFAISLKEFDMVAPCQDVKLSEVLFDKKGRLVTNIISPLTIHRKPENVILDLYPVPARDIIECKEVTIKDITAALEDNGTILLSCKAQLNPTKKMRDRIIDCMGEECEFRCTTTEPELPFDAPVLKQEGMPYVAATSKTIATTSSSKKAGKPRAEKKQAAAKK